jgi:inosine-uridine nucleoside N-ribohydrolase
VSGALASVVLDTDIGTDVDDATALLLLLGLGDVEIASVTTVSGRPEVRALLARRLLEHAGAGALPVAAGHAEPLPTERFAVMLPGPGLWLGHEGKGVLTDDEIAEARPEDAAHADSQMMAALELAAAPVTVLTIGPLTNLATVLEHSPRIGDRIGRVVAMGGVINGPIELAGHALPPAWEYNFNADREAVARVLESGVDVTLVPAELTYQTRFTAADVDALRGVGHPALADLCAMIDIWMSIWPQLLGQLSINPQEVSGYACHLHDSAAVLAAFRPELFEFEDVRIDLVEQNGQLVTAASPDGAFPVHVAACSDMAILNSVILDVLRALPSPPAVT